MTYDEQMARELAILRDERDRHAVQFGDIAVWLSACGIGGGVISDGVRELAKQWQQFRHAAESHWALLHAVAAFAQHKRECAKVTRETVDGHMTRVDPWVADKTDCTCGLTVLRSQIEKPQTAFSVQPAVIEQQEARLMSSALRIALNDFVSRERELLGQKSSGGQSVGRSPSISPSVLRKLERMLLDTEEMDSDGPNLDGGLDEDPGSRFNKD